MSIYLEFPAIEDYPVYHPLEQITVLIPEWLGKSIQLCFSGTDAESNEEDHLHIH
jgi:hypothetical protein